MTLGGVVSKKVRLIFLPSGLGVKDGDSGNDWQGKKRQQRGRIAAVNICGDRCRHWPDGGGKYHDRHEDSLNSAQVLPAEVVDSGNTTAVQIIPR